MSPQHEQELLWWIRECERWKISIVTVAINRDVIRERLRVNAFSSSAHPAPSYQPLATPHHPSLIFFAVAGDGSFYRPYHVDTNDVIVRTVTSRFHLLRHHFWIEFIATLNSQIRRLSQSPKRHTAEVEMVLHGIVLFMDSQRERFRTLGFQVRSRQVSR